jgi:hypothetical protein
MGRKWDLQERFQKESDHHWVTGQKHEQKNLQHPLTLATDEQIECCYQKSNWSKRNDRQFSPTLAVETEKMPSRSDL